MTRFLSFPWGRLFCVIGATISFMGIDKDWSIGGAIALCGFLATGAALHGLAIWRTKP